MDWPAASDLGVEHEYRHFWRTSTAQDAPGATISTRPVVQHPPDCGLELRYDPLADVWRCDCGGLKLTRYEVRHWRADPSWLPRQLTRLEGQ